MNRKKDINETQENPLVTLPTTQDIAERSQCVGEVTSAVVGLLVSSRWIDEGRLTEDFPNIWEKVRATVAASLLDLDTIELARLQALANNRQKGA